MSAVVGALAKILGLFLGLIFLMAGTCKVTDKLDPTTHQMLAEGFKHYATVWKVDKFDKSADEFRVAVGIFEVIAGVLIMLPAVYSLVWPLSWFIVPILLMVLMAGAVYTHIEIKDQPPYVPLVLGVLVLVYLILQTATAAGAASKAPKAPTSTRSTTSVAESKKTK